MTETPYRPCPACGGTEYHSLPDLCLEAQRVVAVGRGTGYQRLGWWRGTLVVCTRCGKTDVFTKNAAELANGLAGATVFRAAGPGGGE